MIVLQSSATALRPCPSGTFENSQQHARVIYGWVYRPTKTQSPAGAAESFSRSAGLRISDLRPVNGSVLSLALWQKSVFIGWPRLSLRRRVELVGLGAVVNPRDQRLPAKSKPVGRVN
jgi:hypothetical protein